jgi:bifunctional non-homologous end joining protein LigD
MPRMAHEVALTHPDRLLFPDDGITKADLAAYLRDVAQVMLPALRERPLSLQRFREGIAAPGFFQKEIPKGAPDWVERVRVPKKGGSVCYPVANDVDTLVWLAQINAITFHVFTARRDRLDRPDRLVIDLDPSDGGDFADVRLAAREVGEQLRAAGLEPFAMTTGSRGLHVVAPLRRTRSTAEVSAFADALGAEAAARHPSLLTTEFHKAERGGRIYVDVARNRPAQTTVPPYVVRPRPGAPVATPLRWEELDDPALRPDGWTLRTVLGRLDALGGDPWAGIAAAARTLPRP